MCAGAILNGGLREFFYGRWLGDLLGQQVGAAFGRFAAAKYTVVGVDAKTDAEATYGPAVVDIVRKYFQPVEA